MELYMLYCTETLPGHDLALTLKHFHQFILRARRRVKEGIMEGLKLPALSRYTARVVNYARLLKINSARVQRRPSVLKTLSDWMSNRIPSHLELTAN